METQSVTFSIDGLGEEAVFLQFFTSFYIVHKVSMFCLFLSNFLAQVIFIIDERVCQLLNFFLAIF